MRIIKMGFIKDTITLMAQFLSILGLLMSMVGSIIALLGILYFLMMLGVI